MNLKPAFSRFLGADPERLHFAAHSHHPWPDVSYEAHKRAWLDAADMMDDKWEKVIGAVVPALQHRLASILGLSDPNSITFAPNTHEFVTRIFSCIEPPVRILTTDAEFHSFARQSRRWEEAGLALVDRVPAEPFDTFAERFTTEARTGVHDLIYLSQVFFDSGFVVPELDHIVASVPNNLTYVVIDGYHAFMARPTHLGSLQERIFYLAGGYKYAMSGEGVCFLHAPPGYGERPVNTGWFAGFGDLAPGVGSRISYAPDGSRFAGATYDPSGLYRMEAVLTWLEKEGIGPREISNHVKGLHHQFLSSGVLPGELIPPPSSERGNFLTFRTPRAEEIYTALHERRVITDRRGDRLRIGFGIYHDNDDVDRLVGVLKETISV